MLVNKIIRLETPAQLDGPKRGRPRKLEMPPLPQEVFDGMSELEREHYDFFVSSYSKDYPNMTPSDQIALRMAALEYVNLLRVQATQLSTGQTISQARQHPGVQLRAWLDSMNATRKARTAGAKKSDETSEERAAVLDALKQLSA